MVITTIVVTGVENIMSVEGPLFLLLLVPLVMIINLLYAADIGSKTGTATLLKQSDVAMGPAICACVHAVGISSPRLPQSMPGGL